MAISYLDNIFNFVDYEYLNPSQNIYGNLVEQGSVSTQVVTTDELKAHLRITTTAENSLLGTYILAATRMAENYCNRHFIKTRYRLFFNDLPDTFSLYYPDCSFSFTNNSGDGLYYMYNGGGSLYTEWGYENWYCNQNTNPCQVKMIKKPSNAISTSDLVGDNDDIYYFQFRTGISDTASGIPEAIKQAIKLIAGDFYYFREDRKRQFPMASEILLQPYKCYF